MSKVRQLAEEVKLDSTIGFTKAYGMYPSNIYECNFVTSKRLFDVVSINIFIRLFILGLNYFGLH